MTSQGKSIVPVWVLTLVGVVVVVAFVPPTDALGWFPVVLAGAVVLTFGIQLSLPRKTGFVRRVTASVCGAVALLAIATAVLAVVASLVG